MSESKFELLFLLSVLRGKKTRAYLILRHEERGANFVVHSMIGIMDI